jgi:hypothetical protein
MTTITTQTITESETISFKNAQITVEDIIPTPGEPDIPLPPPSKNPVDILEVDKGTPDNHVPRDPRLIRLTGVHPFNVEPPLTALYKEGIHSHLPPSSRQAKPMPRLSHIPGTVLCSEPWASTPGPR